MGLLSLIGGEEQTPMGSSEGNERNRQERRVGRNGGAKTFLAD